MFCMAAYGDGPYWKSCLEVMCCPSGYSFYRPFSFRKQYLSQDLQNMIADPNQIKSNISLSSWNAGFVGIRFKSTEFRNKFIPLRTVTLTSIQEQDTIQVFYKLGGYVFHSERVMVVDLDGIIDTSKDEDTLFFSIPADKINRFQNFQESDRLPRQFWERLMSPGEISPEAQDNFLNTLVLRFCGYRLHGTSNTLPPEKIESGGERGYVFGPKLMQGKCYDFDLAYSRIMCAGKVSSDILACQYKWIPQGDTLKVAQCVIPVTGNYRMETVWAEVQQSSPAPIELRFLPMTQGAEETETSAGKIKSFELRVWALTVMKFWTLRRCLVLLESLVALLATVLFFYLSADKSAAYIAALGASAALFTSLFKDFLTGRSK